MTSSAVAQTTVSPAVGKYVKYATYLTYCQFPRDNRHQVRRDAGDPADTPSDLVAPVNQYSDQLQPEVEPQPSQT
jgi:hypothetical protein